MKLPNPVTLLTKIPSDKMEAAYTKTVNSLAADVNYQHTTGAEWTDINIHYTPETHAKIAKYTIEHGNVAAVSKFSKDLQFDITKSAIRAFTKK